MSNATFKTKFITRIQPAHLLFIVLALGILLSLFNYGNPSGVSNIQGQYLMQALGLYEGEWPSHYARGPVYPYLLAVSFVFGEDLYSLAHWLTQGIYFFTIAMVFIFVHKLYGKWVAFVSTSLILLSITLFLTSWKLGVPFLFPFFILTSIVLYFKSVQENRRWMFFTSGMAFGLAFLTKESSLLYIYFPLSLMIFVRDYRSKFAIQGFFIYLLGMITFIIPWAIFLVFKNQNLSVMLGFLLKTGSTGGISFFGYTSIWKYLFGIIFEGSYGAIKQLAKEIPLFLIMTIGLITILWGGFINKDKSDRIYISFFLPSIPIFMAHGLFLDEFRNIVLPLLFLYIALGKLIIKAFTLERKKQLFIIIACGVSILFMIILDFDRIKQYSAKYGSDLPVKLIQRRVTGKFGLEIVPGGRFHKDLANAANWVNENVPQGSLLGIGGQYDHALVFYTNKNYRYGANLPRKSHVCILKKDEPLSTVKKEHDQIVQIATTEKFSRLPEQHRYRTQIYSLYKHNLINFLKYITKEKMWIILHEGEKVIFPIAYSLFSDVTNVVYSGNQVVILESIPGNYDFDALIAKKSFNLLAKGDKPYLQWLDTKRDLRWLRKNKTDEFEQISNCFLSQESFDLNKLL